jgi:hypothetical protein
LDQVSDGLVVPFESDFFGGIPAAVKIDATNSSGIVAFAASPFPESQKAAFSASMVDL